MPNKSTNPDATLMIVVDEVDPPTDPKTYQYVYVGNINNLPSDVLTESSIVDIPGTASDSVMSQKGATDLVSEYNVSTNNNNTEYTFAQAVALVPASLQKGGLTIKYIDSTTHEYTIKRLMSSTWNTTESNWQGVEKSITPNSSNMITGAGIVNKINDFLDLSNDAINDSFTYPIYLSGNLGYIATNGETADITKIISSVNLACAVVKCKANDLFLLKGITGGNIGRAYAFIDNVGNVLKASSPNATITQLSLYAPSDGYLIINSSPTNKIVGYKIVVSKNKNLIPFSRIDNSTNYTLIRIPCYGFKYIRISVQSGNPKPTFGGDKVSFLNNNGTIVTFPAIMQNLQDYLLNKAEDKNLEDYCLPIPSTAYYLQMGVFNENVGKVYAYVYDKFDDIDANLGKPCILYPNNVYVRLGQQANEGDGYTDNEYYNSTNLIPCKNAKFIYRNFDKETVGRTVFKLSSGDYVIKNGYIIEVPEEAISFKCSVVVQNIYPLSRYDSIRVVYDSYDEIDMSVCPIYGIAEINNHTLNILNETTDNLIDDNSPYNALFSVYVGKKKYLGEKESNAPIVFLFGGFGKKLTVDGWLSSTDSWEDFIEEMQEAGITVICGGNWRDTNSSDTYRSDIGAYVLPTLGNPFTAEIFNKALIFARSVFNLKGKLGIIGCSQGGILALNYQYLYGDVSAIVEMAPLVNLEVQGWQQQTDAVKNCYAEWYGFSGNTDYEADKLIGFNPYARMRNIDGHNYLESVPVKMICGGEDHTAGTTYQGIITQAIKNANCVAEMHILPNGSHSIAGGSFAVANYEAILWIKRFC